MPTEGNVLTAREAGAQLDGDAPTPLMLLGPIDRPGTPDDIARVALFCASDLSNLMTGSTLLAYGGTTA